MSETLDVTLRLNDQVSAAASRAAAALKKTEAQAARTQASLGFGKELAGALGKLNKIKLDPGGFQELRRVQRQIADEQKRLTSGGLLGGLSKGLFGFAGPQGSARVWSNVAGVVIGEAIVGAARMAADMFTDGIKKAFDYGINFEKQNLAFELLLGKKDAQDVTADIERYAKQTGYNSEEIRQSYRPLLLSGMNKDQSRQAFAAAGDLAAAGADLNSVIDAFAKIQMGGGIRKMQLREFGVNVPDLYKGLSKTLGVGEQEIEKRIGEVYGGKGSGRGIDPEVLKGAIYDTIVKRQGGILGTGSDKLGATLGARLHQLASLPGEFLKNIASAPGWALLSKKLGDVYGKLDPNGPQGKRIIGGLMSAFNNIADAVMRALTPENIAKFGDAVESVVGYLKEAPAILNKIVTWSEVLLTIWAGNKIVNLLTGVANLTAAFSGLAVAEAPLLAVGAALASIAYAITKISDAAKELGGWDAVKQDLKDWWKGDAPATGHGTHALTAAQQAGGEADVAALARNAGERGRNDSDIGARGAEIFLANRARKQTNQVLVAQNNQFNIGTNDTQHTRQAVTTVTQDGAQRGAERALQGVSGR